MLRVIGDRTEVFIAQRKVDPIEPIGVSNRAFFLVFDAECLRMVSAACPGRMRRLDESAFG